MALKQIRKKMKKANVPFEEKAEHFEEIIRQIFIIFSALTIILAVMYLITGFFVTEDFEYVYNPVDEAIQYEEILYGSILNRKEETYYVLVGDINDLDSLLTDRLDAYQGYKVYKVDLLNKMNSDIKGESTIINEDTLLIEELTMLKVIGGEIDSYYEGLFEILKELN